MVARTSKASQKEGTGASNAANLSHDASCFFPKSAHQTADADENEYKTPVVSRKTSAAEPSGMMKTPDLGHFTRSVIQSLENIKFTPSQGVCTPSPTILVHHHHHVYGATGQGPAPEDQISSAYMAGLAAGRAETERKLQAGLPLIQAAMYESPSVNLRPDLEGVGKGGRHGKDVGEEGGGGVSVDGDNDDARSLDGRGPRESDVRSPREGAHINLQNDGKTARNDRNATDVSKNAAKTWKASPSRSASPAKKPQNRQTVDADDAQQMAFALLSAHRITSVQTREDIPNEVFDLASLLVTLEIPAELMMMPANEFCGQGGAGKRLNARQRRTLRRSQERAWKELETLKSEQAQAGAQYVRRSYSPSCLNYGVNPAALAEYNGYVMAPHGMVQMHSPGVGGYVQPMAYPIMGPGGQVHPQMTHFGPVHGTTHAYGTQENPHGHPHGHPHGRHPGRGQQRTLSRFADR